MKLWIGLTLTFLLSSCTMKYQGDQEAYQAVRYRPRCPRQAPQLIKQAMRYALRDATSARYKFGNCYRNPNKPYSAYKKVWINDKNQYNAYRGFRLYHFFFQYGHLIGYKRVYPPLYQYN